MPVITILRSFKRLKDDALDKKALLIINSLTGNPNFTNPHPSLTEIANSRIAYIDALASAKVGGKQETAYKKQCRNNLETQLNSLGLYINLNCKNDEVVATSSGFDIKKIGKPIGILPKPSNFSLSNGPIKGSLIANIDKIAGAKTYIFEITEVPVTKESIWVKQLSSTKKMLFTGLVSGTEYAIKAAGVGKESLLIYSDILSSFVL